MNTTTTYKKNIKQAIIFAGGSFTEKALIKLELISAFGMEIERKIYCVDSGLLHFENLKLAHGNEFMGMDLREPDFLVGDLDSCQQGRYDLEKKYPSMNIIKLDPIKDFTDTEVALELSISNGATQVVLFGALGNRMDHSMANIMLMEKYAKQGIDIIIVDEKNVIIPLPTEGIKYHIPMLENHYASVMALTDTLVGVNLEGMEYSVRDRDIERSSSLGVSNKVIRDGASISFKKGSGLLILSED